MGCHFLHNFFSFYVCIFHLIVSVAESKNLTYCCLHTNLTNLHHALCLKNGWVLLYAWKTHVIHLKGRYLLQSNMWIWKLDWTSFVRKQCRQTASSERFLSLHGCSLSCTYCVHKHVSYVMLIKLLLFWTINRGFISELDSYSVIVSSSVRKLIFHLVTVEFTELISIL